MIKSIKIKGFQGHEDSVLNLSKGLNVILGDTDTGKSSILRAINWVVTNRPSGDGFVNKLCKECSVEITTDKGTVTHSRIPINSYIVKEIDKKGKRDEEIQGVESFVGGDIFPTLADKYYRYLDEEIVIPTYDIDEEEVVEQKLVEKEEVGEVKQPVSESVNAYLKYL